MSTLYGIIAAPQFYPCRVTIVRLASVRSAGVVVLRCGFFGWIALVLIQVKNAWSESLQIRENVEIERCKREWLWQHVGEEKVLNQRQSKHLKTCPFEHLQSKSTCSNWLVVLLVHSVGGLIIFERFAFAQTAVMSIHITSAPSSHIYPGSKNSLKPI